MWNEPALIALSLVALLVLVLTVRPLGTRWRRAVASAAIVATTVAWTFARREIRARDALQHERSIHCRSIAARLNGTATSATASAPDSVMTRQSRQEIEAPVTGWIVNDIDFCLGKRRPSCQHALYEAMKEADPNDFAAALRAIGRSVEAGTACADAE